MKPEEKIKQLNATNAQVLAFAKRIVELLAERAVINRQMGMNGFAPCVIGSPVFTLKGKYIIYMTSLTEKMEKVYDPERQVFNNQIGIFTVGVTYNIETLKPSIDFI